ncbi:hypothetical protein C8R44DRAFT_727224 [Mycena epipterygia]|nr:hypothetical protein C8R44DRAFT_727224 [Mycena epipterygia]
MGIQHAVAQALQYSAYFTELVQVPTVHNFWNLFTCFESPFMGSQSGKLRQQYRPSTKEDESSRGIILVVSEEQDWPNLEKGSGHDNQIGQNAITKSLYAAAGSLYQPTAHSGELCEIQFNFQSFVRPMQPETNIGNYVAIPLLLFSEMVVMGHNRVKKPQK